MDYQSRFPKGYHGEEPFETYAKAIAYAAKRHKGTYRDGGEAFILHPARIAWRLRRKGESPLVAAAAVLHDTVEQGVATIEEICDEFGQYVANMVIDLTQLEGETNSNYRQRLKEAGTESKTIRLEDRYDNLCGMEGWNGLKVQRYLADTEMLLKALEGTDPDFEHLIRAKTANIRASGRVRIKRPDYVEKILKKANDV